MSSSALWAISTAKSAIRSRSASLCIAMVIKRKSWATGWRSAIKSKQNSSILFSNSSIFLSEAITASASDLSLCLSASTDLKMASSTNDAIVNMYWRNCFNSSSKILSIIPPLHPLKRGNSISLLLCFCGTFTSNSYSAPPRLQLPVSACNIILCPLVLGRGKYFYCLSEFNQFTQKHKSRIIRNPRCLLHIVRHYHYRILFFKPLHQLFYLEGCLRV